MELLRKKRFLIPICGILLAGVLLCVPQVRWWLGDLTFTWQERTETEWKVKAYAEEQGYWFSQYPKSLIELLERNPETESFVLNFPAREAQPVDLSDYADGDRVPLFLQWDPQWGYSKYGSDYLAITGCGPTCLAMAGYHLTGREDFTPDKIARFAETEGYYESGYGSSWTLISQGAGKLGLQAKELPLVKGKIDSALEGGNPVILAMGKGDFTTTGHYIVLTGLEEGGYRVNDPNSILNSQKLWPYEIIEGQIRNIWQISRGE